ncbi:NAD(P)H-binding protein [Mesoterricola sediminis]|uniref:Nucleoside-diphosphate sugar epimerase n=1 Tax=Mesoterricola sediminis TaxID=2927980 RepID=A0AA48GPW2_9BACT|nr:NAD(P)H-binding protein [Mesoterricola sediminis]BDU77066.1 nucleoside-diphosphate sugar epimerase [Mesoterricola sediminis]
MKQVVVAGSTGLVGREILKQLDGREDVEVTALVRRPGALGGLSGRIREAAFDFRSPADLARLGADIPCDLLVCAIGTTLRKAGSPEAFREVDLAIPQALVQRLAELEHRPTFALVSSAGANRPRGLYLQTKAEAERALVDSGLPYLIVRPSLLLGKREEFRLGERLAALFLARPYLFAAKLLAPQSRTLWRYAPIQASQVAKAILWTCLESPQGPGGKVLSGLSLHHPIMAGFTSHAR